MVPSSHRTGGSCQDSLAQVEIKHLASHSEVEALLLLRRRPSHGASAILTNIKVRRSPRSSLREALAAAISIWFLLVNKEILAKPADRRLAS